jgi:hypothetical protein
MYKKYFDVVFQRDADGVVRLSDTAFIPFDPANTDYQVYLKWVENGGVPLPADEPKEQS